MEGPPIPIGAPPPPLTGDPNDPEDDDDDEDGPNCGTLLPQLPTAYPKPSDIPDWANNPGGGGGDPCAWSGTIQVLKEVLTIAVGAGQTSFTANLFDLIRFGSSSYDMAGSTFQVYSTSVTGWSVSFQPATGTVVTSGNFWVNFDLPTGPPSTVISITGQVGGGVSTVRLNIEIRVSIRPFQTFLPWGVLLILMLFP